MIIALTAALTSLAEGKQDEASVENNAAPLKQTLDKLPTLIADLNTEDPLALLSFKSSQSTISFSQNANESVQNSNYKLAPISNDLDFLKEVLPIVDQFSILNNRFGVGLGIKLF